MPVSTTGIEYQVAPGTFAVDLDPLGRQADVRPLADQVLAQMFRFCTGYAENFLLRLKRNPRSL